MDNNGGFPTRPTDTPIRSSTLRATPVSLYHRLPLVAPLAWGLSPNYIDSRRGGSGLRGATIAGTG
jgi:hypothetical protein